MSDLLNISTQEACHRLAAVPETWVGLWKRGDVELEYYAPVGVDAQQPHDRDEIYIVVSGTGTFVRDDACVDFAPGDFLFAGAYVPHRFENFSDDFATWVIFFGPRGAAHRA